MWKIDKGRSTGTTGANYATALTWECAELSVKTIHLFNTDGANSLYYKLLGRYHEGQTAGKEDVLVAETSLGAGKDARMRFFGQYLQLILQVKNNAGAATYEVNYIGQGA